MKLGDLVRWVHPEVCNKDLGVIIGFDHEDDPIIFWQSVGRMCTVRKMVELVNEGR